MILHPNGGVLQSCMLSRPDLSVMSELYGTYLGIVYEVYPSDSDSNKTAQKFENRRGYQCEAKVFLFNDGTECFSFIDHVQLASPFPSSGDDFYETIPKGCSKKLFNEGQFDSNLRDVDPSTLDGEWCIVVFIGGQISQPAIIAWWPNPSNRFDPGTSGNGDNKRAEKHGSRSFRRFNGIETTIDKLGDLTLNTTFANSKFIPGNPSKRNRNAVGGNIKLQMKDSSAVTFDFNGILPDINPKTQQKSNIVNGTTGTLDKNKFELNTTTIKGTTREDVEFISQRKIKLTSVDNTEINAKQANVLATISSKITAPKIDTLSTGVTTLTGGSISLVAPSITLGQTPSTSLIRMDGPGGTISLGAAPAGSGARRRVVCQEDIDEGIKYHLFIAAQMLHNAGDALKQSLGVAPGLPIVQAVIAGEQLEGAANELRAAAEIITATTKVFVLGDEG